MIMCTTHRTNTQCITVARTRSGQDRHPPSPHLGKTPRICTDLKIDPGEDRTGKVTCLKSECATLQGRESANRLRPRDWRLPLADWSRYIRPDGGARPASSKPLANQRINHSNQSQSKSVNAIKRYGLISEQNLSPPLIVFVLLTCMTVAIYFLSVTLVSVWGFAAPQACLARAKDS